MKIHKLTHKNIRPYGYIIDKRCVKDNGRGNRFGILLKEQSKGWRIGFLILRERSIKKLEMHPDSLETFEPIKGACIIALAAGKAPDRPKVFLLDKPVVLKKGVWHDVAACRGACEIKIFENIEVGVKYHRLKREIVARKAKAYVREI